MKWTLPSGKHAKTQALSFNTYSESLLNQSKVTMKGKQILFNEKDFSFSSEQSLEVYLLKSYCR